MLHLRYSSLFFKYVLQLNVKLTGINYKITVLEIMKCTYLTISFQTYFILFVGRLLHAQTCTEYVTKLNLFLIKQVFKLKIT